MGGTPGAPPPLGHCPRDVINLKNAPTLGHSQAPPPLDIAPVTSSTYSKGGTKLLKGGTKLLKGGTKLLKGGTKLLKGGTKSLGWATGGGVVRPPRPPPPPGYGPVQSRGREKRVSASLISRKGGAPRPLFLRPWSISRYPQ